MSDRKGSKTSHKPEATSATAADATGPAAKTAGAINEDAVKTVLPSAPMSRQKILEKLAEAARQKRTQRLASNPDDTWEKQAAQVLRSWLLE